MSLRGLALVSSLVLSLGSCALPTGTGPLLPPEWKDTIRKEWTLAQNVLDCLGFEEARSVAPETFRWKVHSEQFKCADYITSGCFDASSRQIDFYSGHPWVIRHEAGHAILHELSPDSFFWRCFGHGDLAEDGCERFPEITYWEQYCSLEGRRYK